MICCCIGSGNGELFRQGGWPALRGEAVPFVLISLRWPRRARHDATVAPSWSSRTLQTWSRIHVRYKQRMALLLLNASLCVRRPERCRAFAAASAAPCVRARARALSADAMAQVLPPSANCRAPISCVPHPVLLPRPPSPSQQRQNSRRHLLISTKGTYLHRRHIRYTYTLSTLTLSHSLALFC